MSDFSSEVISYGIIPIKWVNNRPKFFLVHHQKGHWGFPKGRPEMGEEALSSAKRELFEETGLRVTKLYLCPPFEENYIYDYKGKKILKKVIYFLAEASGKVCFQEEEISEGGWYYVDEIESKLIFKEGKILFKSVLETIASL